MVCIFAREKLDTLVDRLATLEMKLESLGDQQAERGKVVQNLLDEMATINENMDRQPEASAVEKMKEVVCSARLFRQQWCLERVRGYCGRFFTSSFS